MIHSPASASEVCMPRKSYRSARILLILAGAGLFGICLYFIFFPGRGVSAFRVGLGLDHLASSTVRWTAVGASVVLITCLAFVLVGMARARGWALAVSGMVFCTLAINGLIQLILLLFLQDAAHATGPLLIGIAALLLGGAGITAIFLGARRTH